MALMTSARAAALWGIGERRVAALCAQGRVGGAHKMGGNWVIPESAPKPASRQGRRPEGPAAGRGSFFLPLLSRPYLPGHLEEALVRTRDPDAKNLNLAELSLMRCDFEDACQRLCAPAPNETSYAALRRAYSLFRLALCRDPALWNDAEDLLRTVRAQAARDEKVRAGAELIESIMTTGLCALDRAAPWFAAGDFERLPEGAHMTACCMYTLHTALCGKTQRALGQAAAFIEMNRVLGTPLATVYLRIMRAVMLYRTGARAEAERQFCRAAEDAFADGVLLPFVYLHPLTMGLDRRVLEPLYPELFKQICRHSAVFTENWASIRRALGERAIPIAFSEREYAVARLAAGGMTNAEIARVLSLSAGTVKNYLKAIFAKLGIHRRGDLPRYVV